MATPDEFGDARRTLLASERTWLAWVRTGFTSTAVSIGIGRIVPSVGHLTRWPYTVIGVGYALLGVALVIYGLVRRRRVESDMLRGEFKARDEVAMFIFVGTAALLGLACAALVIVG